MLEDLDAADSADANVVQVVAKSQLYAGVHILTLIACVLLWLLPSWWRWVAGMLVTFALLTSCSMAGVLHTLHRANRFYNRVDVVLQNHRLMNAAGILLLLYALAAVWTGLPGSFLAVLLSAFLNFMHFAGYRSAAERVLARKSQHASVGQPGS
jgi:MFS superfamily sulfate permease-like transporter